MYVRDRWCLDRHQLHATLSFGVIGPRPMLVMMVALGAVTCGDVLPPAVIAVTVTPPTAALIAGETVQLAAETWIDPTMVVDDRELIWSVSDPAIAAISATGLVTAVAPGPPVTITARSEGQTGTAMVVVTGPVASIAIGGAPRWPMIVRASARLTAELRDASGTAVVGRTIRWSSSDPAVAAVSETGVVTAQALGGPATITAAYGDHVAETRVTTALGIITGITSIHSFIQTCPPSDPAFDAIKADFELRENGVVLTRPLTCGSTYSTTPIIELSDELIAYQVLRIAYHMSEGTAGKLPWTSRPLYDWMKSAIAGINFKTEPGQLYCCDLIDGKRYFSMSRLDDFNREQKRDWPGLASSLDFFLHEIRHTDGPAHTTGCPAFPTPTGPAGCDATYDLSYLGSYGVQYWLNAHWATSFLHIGLNCASPDVQTRYVTAMVSAANSSIDRFVSSAPPPVVSEVLYGGPCP